MAKISALSPMSLNLRARITVWYVLLVGLTLVAFSIFLYFRLQVSLVSQLDASLEVATSQALNSLETRNGRFVFDKRAIEYVGEVASLTEDRLALTDGTSFEINENTLFSIDPEIGEDVEVDAEITVQGLIALEFDEASIDPDEEDVQEQQTINLAPTQQLRNSDFILRIVGPDGIMSDGLGDTPLVPFPSPDEFDFATVTSQDGQAWRIHTFDLVSSENDSIGWLQTAKSFESVDATLGSIRTQLFWGIPLVLALAALGGLFVADRGLRPIDRIARTAQTISGSVLNSRINHTGPDDEVGRLSKTFDAMLDRLEEAFERERRFTSDASHELRTPLTSLKGRIEVALNSPRTQAEYEETLHSLEEEAERLIRLSSELLFLARLEQGEIPLQPEDVDLGNLLGAVIDQIRPLAESKNLTIIEEIPPDLSLRGDPDHLIRLFLNIVDNAYKHTPSGGRITVRGRNTGPQAIVSISDTGPGIPSEHLPHLFDRFYRVDNARSRDSGGTGLGLSIASEIVQIHGGTLDVKSEVGTGSTFIITLPYQHS